MQTDDPKSDAEIVALAKAERDAGVPDIQTAAAAAAIQSREADEDPAGNPDETPTSRV